MNVNVLKSEITYTYARSSGSGGQHLNKVASKAMLHFNFETSKAFSSIEKQQLLLFFCTRLTKNAILILSCSDSRSQFRNKATVTERFLRLIEAGLKTKTKRIPTKISKSAIKKRLNTKRKHSEKKALRRSLDGY